MAISNCQPQPQPKLGNPFNARMQATPFSLVPSSQPARSQSARQQVVAETMNSQVPRTCEREHDNDDNYDDDHNSSTPSSTSMIIIHPSRVRKTDVLFGRGSGATSSAGNQEFSALLRCFEVQYDNARERGGKVKIAKQIVHHVLAQNGRFLRKVSADESAAVARRNGSGDGDHDQEEHGESDFFTIWDSSSQQRNRNVEYDNDDGNTRGRRPLSSASAAPPSTSNAIQQEGAAPPGNNKSRFVSSHHFTVIQDEAVLVQKVKQALRHLIQCKKRTEKRYLSGHAAATSSKKKRKKKRDHHEDSDDENRKPPPQHQVLLSELEERGSQQELLSMMIEEPTRRTAQPLPPPAAITHEEGPFFSSSPTAHPLHHTGAGREQDFARLAERRSEELPRGILAQEGAVMPTPLLLQLTLALSSLSPVGSAPPLDNHVLGQILRLQLVAECDKATQLLANLRHLLLNHGDDGSGGMSQQNYQQQQQQPQQDYPPPLPAMTAGASSLNQPPLPSAPPALPIMNQENLVAWIRLLLSMGTPQQQVHNQQAQERATMEQG